MNQFSIDLRSVNTLREQLGRQLELGKIDQVESDLQTYIEAISKLFQSSPNNKVERNQLNDLGQLITDHQELVKSLKFKKEHILEEIKKIKLGKNMQETYPQT